MIQLGGIGGRRLANTYNDRGYSYSDRGDIALAIADYDAGLRLAPRNATLVSNRAAAYAALDDSARAIEAYSVAIRLDPKYTGNFRGRGILLFYAGQPERAAKDLRQARRLDPKDGYGALWYDIVTRHRQGAKHLRQDAARVDMAHWPAPVVRLFLGQTTPAAVLAAADSPAAGTKAGQLCEARFYSGLIALRANARDEAVTLLRSAAATCPKIFVESPAARSELKLLGETP